MVCFLLGCKFRNLAKFFLSMDLNSNPSTRHVRLACYQLLHCLARQEVSPNITYGLILKSLSLLWICYDKSVKAKYCWYWRGFISLAYYNSQSHTAKVWTSLKEKCGHCMLDQCSIHYSSVTKCNIHTLPWKKSLLWQYEVGNH